MAISVQSPDKRPIRVLHLISSRGLYGAERVVINLIAAADRCRVIPSLALLKPQDYISEAIVEAVRAKNAEAHIISFRRWVDMEAIRLLIALIKSKSIDIVHCHGLKGRLYGLLLAAATRVKIITTHHNWVKSDLRVSLFEALDACYIRLFPRIIAVSPEIRETMLSWMIPDRKIHIIINGVDTNEFKMNTSARRRIRKELGIGRKMRLVGTFGRISPEKGHKYFIGAAAYISQILPDTRFIIVGDGQQDEELKTYASNLGIQDNVLFCGFKDNIIDYFSAIDIFVLPSILEGTPMVILEAMSCGVPVVATNVGGIPYIINNNTDGLMVKPKDVIELAEAIIKLLNDKQYASFISTNALYKVTTYYSSEVMSNEYINTYTQILNAGISVGCNDQI